jgi:hypothetical protein
MTTKLTSLRTLLAALLVAGGVGVACSSHQRSHEPTTVAEAPLGKSTKDYPANPSVLPPDAAEAPEQNVGPTHTLSSGAVHGATTAPVANNPNGVNGPGANAPTNTGGTPVNVPVPVNTPTNPSTPAPTPASPNAPTPTPAPNPMPPTGGAPVQGAPNTGTTGTGPTGTGPAPQTQPRSTPPSTVPEARGTFAEPLDPYQLRADGGIGAPRPPADASVPRDAAPSPIRVDGGPGARADAGIGIGIRNDGGLR